MDRQEMAYSIEHYRERAKLAEDERDHLRTLARELYGALEKAEVGGDVTDEVGNSYECCVECGAIHKTRGSKWVTDHANCYIGEALHRAREAGIEPTRDEGGG